MKTNKTTAPRYELIADLLDGDSLTLWSTDSYFEALDGFLTYRNVTRVFDNATGKTIHRAK